MPPLPAAPQGDSDSPYLTFLGPGCLIMGIWLWWWWQAAGPFPVARALWGVQVVGAMASLGSASAFHTYGQGHGEPCFEGDRRHSPFGARAHDAFGYPGSPGAICPCSLGTWVRAQGDTYQVVADVSQFEPPDIVVTTSNCHVAIQAEKVAEDGTICDSFTHKCQLPEDTDPLSVSCALTEAGTLIITARRRTGTRPGEPPQPRYRSEATL